jgi:hypothetical protein
VQVENLLREWRASPERALTIALCDALADRGAIPAGTTDYEVVLHVGGYAGVRYGEDPEVLVAVGRMYLVAGEMRRALTPLAQAAKLSSSPAAFRLLGVLLLRMGQAKRAVQAFDRAIEGGIDDAETRAWHASAEAYKQVQEELGAEVVAERVAQGLETRQPLDGGGVASSVPGTVPGGFSAASAAIDDAATPMPPPRAVMSSVTEVMPSRMSAGDFVPPPFPIAEEDTATDTRDPRPAGSSRPSPLPGDHDSPISSLPGQNMDSTLKAARPALSFGRDDDPSSMDDPTAVISVKRLLDSRYVQADAPGRRVPDAQAGRRPQSTGVDFDLDRDGLVMDDLETNVYGSEDSATQSELVTGQVRIQAQAEAARAPEPTMAAPADAPAAPAPEAGRVPAIASKTVPIVAEDRSDASHGTGAPLAKPVDAAAGTNRPAKRGGASMTVAAMVVLVIVGAGVGLRAGKLPWLAQHLPPWASQGANDSMPVQPEVTAAQGPSTARVEPVGAAASSGAPSAEVAPTTAAAVQPASASIATPPPTAPITAAPSTGAPVRTAAPRSPAPSGTPVAQPPRRQPPRAPTATPTTTPKEAPDAPIWLGDPELQNQ